MTGRMRFGRVFAGLIYQLEVVCAPPNGDQVNLDDAG